MCVCKAGSDVACRRRGTRWGLCIQLPASGSKCARGLSNSLLDPLNIQQKHGQKQLVAGAPRDAVYKPGEMGGDEALEGIVEQAYGIPIPNTCPV